MQGGYGKQTCYGKIFDQLLFLRISNFGVSPEAKEIVNVKFNFDHKTRPWVSFNGDNNDITADIKTQPLKSFFMNLKRSDSLSFYTKRVIKGKFVLFLLASHPFLHNLLKISRPICNTCHIFPSIQSST